VPGLFGRPAERAGFEDGEELRGLGGASPQVVGRAELRVGGSGESGAGRRRAGTDDLWFSGPHCGGARGRRREAEAGAQRPDFRVQGVLGDGAGIAAGVQGGDA